MTRFYSIPVSPKFKGEKGDPGPPGPGTQINASGTPAQRSTYDSQPAGFVYADTSVTPFRISVRETSTPGVWSQWAPLQGPTGAPGSPGLDSFADWKVRTNQPSATYEDYRSAFKGDTGNAGAPGADGAPGTPGTPGVQGAPGVDGKTIHTVSGAPLDSLGVNGDYAIDPTANLRYGPKAAGTWPSGVSMQGPQGVQGIQGAPGADGLSFQANASGTFAERSQYDTQAPGFSFYVIEEDAYYFRETETVGVWSAARARTIPGPQGPQGLAGPPGPGVPTGGQTGMFIRKKSGSNYDFEYAYPDQATTSVSGTVRYASAAQLETPDNLLLRAVEATALKAELARRRAQINLVTDYGAKMDGTVDIAPVLQQAINDLPLKGGLRRIVLPAGGVYLWNSEVVLDKDSVELDLGGIHGKSEATGGHIKLGSSMANKTMLKITRSQWHIDNTFNASAGQTVKNMSVMSDRSVIINNVIWCERADEVSIENLRGHHVAGRLLYMQRCVKPSVRQVHAIQCGAPGKSTVHIASIDGTMYAQGANFSDMKIETSYGDNAYGTGSTDAYFFVGSDVRDCKFDQIGFESAIGIGATQLKYMTVYGTDNILSEIHGGKFDPAFTANTFSPFELRGDWNRIHNLKCHGYTPSHWLRIFGEANSVNGMTARFSSDESKYAVYMESGILHSATDITALRGLSLAILVAVGHARGMGLTSYRPGGQTAGLVNNSTTSTTSNAILRSTT